MDDADDEGELDIVLLVVSNLARLGTEDFEQQQQQRFDDKKVNDPLKRQKKNPYVDVLKIHSSQFHSRQLHGSDVFHVVLHQTCDMRR